MNKIVCVLSLCLLIGLGIIYNNRPRSIEGIDVDSIIADADHEVFERVLHKLHRLLKKHDNEESWNTLGDFFLCYGYTQEAAHIYQASIQRFPKSYSAHIGLAVCLDQLGYIEKACAYYQEAIVLAQHPNERLENTQRLGELYLRLGHIEKAKHLFASLAYAPALVDLCRIYVFEQNWEAARKTFLALLRADPKQQSIEITQLNALALRHFNKEFAAVPIVEERDAIFSMNLPLEFKRVLIERLFDLYASDLYSETKHMPFNEIRTLQFTEDELQQASLNPDIVQRGRKIYERHNCIVCHGQDAYGATGPNLRDDFWITQMDGVLSIYRTIRYGRAQNTMPGFKYLLGPEQIRDVSAYVINLNRLSKKNSSGHSPAEIEHKEAQGTKQALFK